MTGVSGRAAARLQRHARAVFGAALVAVAALSLLPPPGGALLGAVPGLDKLVHVAMYGTLTALGLRAHPRRRRWHVALALAAYGVALEGIQGLVPERTLSLADALANCAGISIMLLVAARRARRRNAAAS